MSTTASNANSVPFLLPHHQAMLDASAIRADVATARGYRTVTAKVDVARLGFGTAQRNVPALLVPIWNAAGDIATYQLRPDSPRVLNGKAIKYETPGGSRMVLDVPPAARERLGDPTTPLVITEGARKADAAVSAGLCCVALLGVWNWRGTNDDGGATALPDWEYVALKGRREGRVVYLAFDSDVMTKPAVYGALRRLWAFLHQRGAHVQAIYLPPGADGSKTGLDDYLARGGTVASLLALAADDLKPPPGGDDDAPDGPYAERDGALCYRKRDRDGDVWIPLCNFTARITEEVIADDGAAQRGEVVVEGRLSDGQVLPAARVPLARFDGLSWVSPNWGTRAVVSAGMGARDRLREAIQRASTEVTRRTIFEHPGWRLLDDLGWVYLHSDGGISAAGSTTTPHVRLRGAAAGMTLPDPPRGDDLITAIRASLAVREVAPHAITTPLLGAVYRAPLLGAVPADTTLWLAGPTGVMKSELAALAQQHYGARFDRLHLPAQFSATANALERVLFDFKDALVVVDDFAPTGSTHDVHRYHATADRVLRGAGNGAGRSRMNADGTLRPDYPPRGLVLATGEDVVRGQSARARTVVVEVGPGDVNSGRLKLSQAAGREGLLATALAGYVRWLAPRLDNLRANLPATLADVRSRLIGPRMHARTPEALANLAVGWQVWLNYAHDVGALTRDQAEAAFERAWTALSALAADQVGHQEGEEPAARFLELLAAAIASGAAHVANPQGGAPEEPGAWGWRQRTTGGTGFERDEWIATGPLVAWLDGTDLYLELDAAYAAAQRLGAGIGTPVTVQPKTLAKRMNQAGLLLATESERRELKVRKTLSGQRRHVLHIAARSLFPAQSGQSRQAAHQQVDLPSSGATRPHSGGIPGAETDERDSKSRQENPSNASRPCEEGRIGGIGGKIPQGGSPDGTRVGARLEPFGMVDGWCFVCGIQRDAEGPCPRCHPSPGMDRWTA